MKTRSTPGFMSTALNDFLFAAVGTEGNGMSLSMVSVFARQGSDPWREAGQLSDLPKPQATERLAQAIARMPGSQWDLSEATDIAGRLVGLLPVRQASAALDVISSGWNWNPLTPANLLLIGGMVVVGLLVVNWL